MSNAISNETSLYLLKDIALNADFNVLIRVDQKLIKKKEVRPINSQPRNNTKKLPLDTSNSMLITNKFIRSRSRSTFGSYLK